MSGESVPAVVSHTAGTADKLTSAKYPGHLHLVVLQTRIHDDQGCGW